MPKQDGEQLAFYPGAFPANRFPSPGSEAAQQMTVTSGRKCSELLPSCDPLSSLAKMLLVSSQWRSRLVNLEWKAETLPLTRIVTQERSVPKKNDMSSPGYCKTLNISVTKSNYLYFRIVPSTPRTDATGYVLLPTPTASDGAQGGVIGADDTYRTTESGTLRKVNRNGADGSIGLGRLVQMWPTPRAKEDNDYQLSGGKRIETLQGAVKARATPTDAVTMWSTQTACEWKGRGPNSKQQGLAEEVKLWVGTPTAAMRERSGKFKVGRVPNPAEFVQLFPTPTARAHMPPSDCQNRQGTADLQTAIRMLPTPQARDWKGMQGISYKGKGVDLPCAVQMFPTPTVGAPMCGGSGNYKHLKKMEINGDITAQERSGMASKSGGQLNPDWVEWLMGFPAGWTDIAKDVPLPEYDPHWYNVEPDIPRTATGIANRVDRLKCEGNAVDPYQFYPVMECIAEILKKLRG